MVALIGFIEWVFGGIFQAALVISIVTTPFALGGAIGPILPVASFFVAASAGLVCTLIDPLTDICEAIDDVARRIFRKP